MQIPIPSVNVTDLYIGHLHVGEISLTSINLDQVSFGPISKMGDIYYIYLLLWIVTIVTLLQALLVCIIGRHLYKKRKITKRIDQLNAILLEDT